MIAPDMLRALMTLTVCYTGGLLLGFVYFKALRLTTDLIVTNERPIMGIVLTIGRLGLICAGFYVAVLIGALALLAALTGVLSAKALIMRHISRSDA